MKGICTLKTTTWESHSFQHEHLAPIELKHQFQIHTVQCFLFTLNTMWLLSRHHWIFCTAINGHMGVKGHGSFCFPSETKFAVHFQIFEMSNEIMVSNYTVTWCWMFCGIKFEVCHSADVIAEHGVGESPSCRAIKGSMPFTFFFFFCHSESHANHCICPCYTAKSDPISPFRSMFSRDAYFNYVAVFWISIGGTSTLM